MKNDNPKGGEGKVEKGRDKPFRPTIGMELSGTHKRLHDALRRASEKAGLPEGYRKLLFHLEHGDGLTQLELAKKAHLSAPTVSVTLKRMESDGLLHRESDEKDQRNTRVYLTAEGRELNARVFESMLRVDAELVKGFSPEEQESFRHMLERMNQNLEGMNL